MESLKRISELLLPTLPADAMAVGVINFQKKSFESFELFKTEEGVSYQGSSPYYDLASLTKPLSNSLSYFLKPKSFTEEMLKCLSHRGGLPAWGLLPKEGWQKQILSYEVKDAPTLYSDFSALRVLLELNKSGDMKKICEAVWDKEVLCWLDLPLGVPLLQFGFKNGEPNFGEVHDPNAYNLQNFCSHAGLFGTIQGVCKTLLNYEKETGFLAQVKLDLGKHQHRFSYGWDRVENPENTLAGKGCSKSSFGHLGFTGTSIWIDPDRGLGHVILTNSTKDHWFAKNELNDLRRALGEMVWKDL